MATLDRKRMAQRARHQTLEQLLEQQESVLRYRRQILRDNAISEVMDAEERSQDAVQQTVGSFLAELASRTLHGIETALKRVDSGQFETCADCGGRIAGARLRALPFATQCRECSEFTDQVRTPADDVEAAPLWPGPDARLEVLGE